MSQSKADVVITNIGQLLTMDPDRTTRPGPDKPPGALGLIPAAALAMAGDRLVWLGPEEDLRGAVHLDDAQVIDAGGRVVMPGLVDCHTHLIFAGSRAAEFDRRLSGDSYEQILAAGGGIHSTVRATRAASEDELVWSGLGRLATCLRFGVTTVEVKSGYGLDVESELKILRAARRLSEAQPVEVIGTFLGAHVIPREYSRDRAGYLNLLKEEMIPRVAAEGLARFCDVFCEEGAFSVQESREILECARSHGLAPKIHGEQLSRSGSVDLALEVQAASIDHLERASAEDAHRLAGSKTVAVLLPGATYFLGKREFADGRRLADAGCRLAVSTDFNPGSCCSENLPLMLNMACLFNGLHPHEALLGATRRAAQALLLDDELGSLKAGLRADVLVLDLHDYRDFIYHFGVEHTHMVFVGGKLAWSTAGGPKSAAGDGGAQPA